MDEVTTSVMFGWLEAHGGPIAAAIRDRIQHDAERISDLTNDRDEYAQQVKDLKEAAWLTR